MPGKSTACFVLVLKLNHTRNVIYAKRNHWGLVYTCIFRITPALPPYREQFPIFHNEQNFSFHVPGGHHAYDMERGYHLSVQSSFKMIVLNLRCAMDHPFEGWFASPHAFDDQAAKGMLSCPVCGSVEINRLPSGPRVISHSSASKGKSLAEPELTPEALSLLGALAEAARTAEDVAERFPEEARKIHYGEVPARGIKGQASLAETRELLEEGIAVLPVPGVNKNKVH